MPRRAKRRRRSQQPPELHPLVAEAQRRGYLTIKDNRITYHCARDYQDDWNDPEEKIRARTYAWLIIEKGYLPDRIDIEVMVPRRTPSDFADIVLYYIVMTGARNPSSLLRTSQKMSPIRKNVKPLNRDTATLTRSVPLTCFMTRGQSQSYTTLGTFLLENVKGIGLAIEKSSSRTTGPRTSSRLSQAQIQTSHPSAQVSLRQGSEELTPSSGAVASAIP